MRHLCKECLEDEGDGEVYTIAIIGTLDCDGCGKKIKDSEINAVSDSILGGYLNRIRNAKKRARAAVEMMANNKVKPLEVYIYKDRNFTFMVPINPALEPVQIIGKGEINF